MSEAVGAKERGDKETQKKAGQMIRKIVQQASALGDFYNSNLLFPFSSMWCFFLRVM